VNGRPPVAGSTGSGTAAAVDVVIVTYNSADHIVDCLDSLLPQLPDDGSTVIVVDNASSDGSADLVATRYPQLHLVRSAENLGFARACNLAATRSSAAHVLLLNPDTVVHPGCIDALLEISERRPEAGIYGGRSFDRAGELDPKSAWGTPTLWSLFCTASGLSTAMPDHELFNPEGMGDWARDDERTVGAVTGCLLLARRDVWQLLGGFDERFFMYGEDIDLGIRAAQLGFAPCLAPAAEITHFVGGSSPSVEKEILIYRGKMSLLTTIWSGWRLRLARTMVLGGVWLRARAAGAVRSLWKVRRNADHQTAPSTWTSLWRRRSEWSEGWTT